MTAEEATKEAMPAGTADERDWVDPCGLLLAPLLPPPPPRNPSLLPVVSLIPVVVGAAMAVGGWRTGGCCWCCWPVFVGAGTVEWLPACIVACVLVILVLPPARMEPRPLAAVAAVAATPRPATPSTDAAGAMEAEAEAPVPKRRPQCENFFLIA